MQLARKPNQIASLDIRIDSDLKDIGLNKKHISLNFAPTPPRFLRSPKIHFDLTCYIKSCTSPELFQGKFLEIQDRLREYY